MIRHTSLLVLGSGPAGYTAAIYAARAMLDPVVISGLQEGGQLTITTEVENYPGFAKAIEGPWLMSEMRAQAEHVGAELVTDIVVSVNLDVRPFVVTCDSGQVWTCDSMVIATGAQAKWLGLDSENHFQGFGVSACATCDGFFYRGKDVVVVGGGNTAVEEALYLSGIARNVTVVHRGKAFRAEKILVDRLSTKDNVKIVWDAEIVEITGIDVPMRSVTGVVLRDRTGGERTAMPTDGVFVAIGHAPAVDLFREKLRLKESGYLWVEPGTARTSIEGVFAAGDVADDTYRQAVTSAGMGCMAALEAERWLAASASVPILEAAE